MLKEFNFALKTRIEFGDGKISLTGEIAKELGAKKAIIVTDQNVIKTEVFNIVSESLTECGIQTVIYSKVQPDPTSSNAEEAGLYARSQNVDVVIGLGGGSSMDIGKAVAAMLTNPGGIREIMEPNQMTYDAMPLICIPTTAGTGSEVTSFAVLTLEDEGIKSSIYDDKARPKVAICDPSVLKTVPSHVAAATGMDALTHAIEAYTCTAANEITDGMALQSIKLISENLSDHVHNNSEKSRRGMMLGSLLAGISFGFSDIAGVHCMAEALGGMCHVSHGVANSMFLANVFEYNIPADVKKHKEVGLALGIDPIGKSDRETAQAAADWIKVLSEDIGIMRFCEMESIDPEKFDKLAELCLLNVSLPSNPRRMTKEDFIMLYEKAYSGDKRKE